MLAAMSFESMTPTEARRYLEARMLKRLDNHHISWSLTDAHAARLVLKSMTELEQQLKLRPSR